MTTGEGPRTAIRWLRNATNGVTRIQRVTLIALLATDVLYRVAIRSYVRRAIGI
jgi:hypothetical protein